MELAPGRRSKAASWEEVAEFVLVQDEGELDDGGVENDKSPPGLISAHWVGGLDESVLEDQNV